MPDDETYDDRADLGPCMHGGCLHDAIDIVSHEEPDHPEFLGQTHNCCCDHPSGAKLRGLLAGAEKVMNSALRRVAQQVEPLVPRFLDYMHEVNPGVGQSWSAYEWSMTSDASTSATGYVGFTAMVFGEVEAVSIPWAFFDDPEGWMKKNREERNSASSRARRARDEEVRRQEIGLLKDLMDRYPDEVAEIGLG